MSNITKPCIYKIMAFNQYCELNNYPKDIINTIIFYYHKSFRIKIRCGQSHYLLLIDGNVYSWGYNEHNQLGLDLYAFTWIENENTSIPTYIKYPTKLKLENIKNIYCNTNNSVALTYSGEVFTWGKNEHGQLGPRYCYRTDKGSPQKIDLPKIKKVICNNDSMIVLTIFGEAYVLGLNEYGKLGIGDDHRMRICFPIKINLENIVDIVSGDSYHIAITKCGKLYSWGKNDFGQLGLGHYNDMNTPQEINLPNIKKISCGRRSNVIALTHYEKVYTWGVNMFSGKLGLSCEKNFNLPQELNIKNISNIKCGTSNVILITNSNKRYIFGDIAYDNLELDKNTNKLMTNSKISNKKYNGIKIINPNGIEIFGYNKREQAPYRGTGVMLLKKSLLKINLANVKTVKHSHKNFLALTYFNDVYMCYSNDKLPKLITIKEQINTNNSIEPTQSLINDLTTKYATDNVSNIAPEIQISINLFWLFFDNMLTYFSYDG